MTDTVARLSSSLADRYVIERELGQGGMATVYLAHDVRHDRRVALKVLRPELSAILGGDRFLHEIKTTANLQHPHILSLFDSGEADGLVYYVMPYVEGESLRDRLNRDKQLPVDEAVRIAREVADALEYAHQHGIVHRDIKPENILLHGGHAMVADFGIALAASRSEGSTRMTETGMSLGTPHYMSPEQAMGEREITPKADIYALGCVLYEMLTAEPPFIGATAQAVIARVMTEEPRSLTLQRKTIPPHVEAAVECALQKLPADRWATAREFSAALNDDGATGRRGAGVRHTSRHPVTPSPRLVPWAITGLALAVAAVTVALAGRDRPAPVARFRMLLDSTQLLFFTGQANPPRVDVSPDGAEMVYVGVSPQSGGVSIGNLGSAILGSGTSGVTVSSAGLNVLIQRRFGDFSAQVLPGTEGAWVPQYSPDGERVAFVVNASGRLAAKVLALSGGPPLTVLDSTIGSAVAWGPDDFLYFVHATEPAVYRVSASGGAPELVTRLAGQDGMQLDWPSVLPSGRGIILTSVREGTGLQITGAEASARVFDLRTGEMRATVAGVFARYSPTGHLIYVTIDGAMMATPFNERRLEVTGRPAALFDGVDVRNQGSTDVALSRTGTLAFTTNSINAPETVSWVTRDGSAARVDPSWTRDWEFEGLALSPDGRRAAVSIETGNRGDIWVKQLDRGPVTRLTFTGDYNGAPTWTPDGRFVTYVAVRARGGDVRRTAADGSGGDTSLVALERTIHFAEWSRDGRWLILSVGGGSDDILGMRVGTDSAPAPVLAEAFNEFLPALSPDGKWLAYVSDESGRSEVYLRPFPAVSTGKWQLSTEGGGEPVWSANGRELYFRSPDRGAILSVDLSRGAGAAVPRVITRLPISDDFESNPRNRLFDVAPGGGFLMIQRANATDVSGDLVVVLNWFTELRSARVRQ